MSLKLLIGAFLAFSPLAFAEDPIVFTVPPVDIQTGGDEFFSKLIPVNKELPGTMPGSGQKSFVNQKVNLELLGPGTNVTFVTDKTLTYFAFGISNGRYESIGDLGRLDNLTYPNKLPERTGKYPWPRDRHGGYLPATMLHPSNGPHGILEFTVKSYHRRKTGSKEQIELIAGHVGINAVGKAYIGYVSGSVNGMMKSQKNSSLGDGRALPADMRSILHAAIKQFVEGRGIEKVLQQVPEDEESIKFKNAVQHFPSSSLIPLSDFRERAAPAGLLAERFSESEYLEYVNKMAGSSAVALWASFMTAEGASAKQRLPKVFEQLEAKVDAALKSDAKARLTATTIWLDHELTRDFLTHRLAVGDRTTLELSYHQINEIIKAHSRSNLDQSKFMVEILSRTDVATLSKWSYSFLNTKSARDLMLLVLDVHHDADLLASELVLGLWKSKGMAAESKLREFVSQLSTSATTRIMAAIKSSNVRDPENLKKIITDGQAERCERIITSKAAGDTP